MERIRTAVATAAVALVVSALVTGGPALSAKDAPASGGIAPEKVADYVHAILQADRMIYTTQIVTRMQDKNIVNATEHWEQDNALPLPAQFLQQSGRLVAESGRGIRYRLISLFPIYQRNAPVTDFERNALETLIRQPDQPVTGRVTSGKKQYFQAIYPDRAVSGVCINCHNRHPLSPKRDFKMQEVMGGIAITIPLE